MLDAHVDSLSDDAVSDSLVDDDSDGAFSDVEDASGLAVVELVGHAFVYSAVDFDVDVVASPEHGSAFVEGNSACSAEWLREQVASFGLQAFVVRHLMANITNH